MEGWGDLSGEFVSVNRGLIAAGVVRVVGAKGGEVLDQESGQEGTKARMLAE